MSTTYEFFARFAQTWGLVYFVVLFIAVLVYALWPSRQKQFDESARVPLRED
ncbi:MAG: cbb3-type cytochrome c oxidase subunit 3 [Xanthobacteraceae bacterium]|nr:cbb3-type cytochrome c oxidase subunit 3 [Xanthobacteraceae bacterium]